MDQSLHFSDFSEKRYRWVLKPRTHGTQLGRFFPYIPVCVRVKRVLVPRLIKGLYINILHLVPACFSSIGLCRKGRTFRLYVCLLLTCTNVGIIIIIIISRSETAVGFSHVRTRLFQFSNDAGRPAAQQAGLTSQQLFGR